MEKIKYKGQVQDQVEALGEKFMKLLEMTEEV